MSESLRAENKPQSDGSMWLALIAIVLGTFVSVLNSSLMNVALTKFVAVFGSDVSTVQWVITAYMLASAVVIPMSGYLGERFGNKNIFIWSVAGFTAGSVLCGLAWNASSLILFRIIQGIAGGFIMPVGMAIIYTIFPREKTGMALGLWGVAAMVAPALGPTFGGYLIQYYSWRLLFFINIPIGIFAVVMGQILLKASPRKTGLKFDLAGAVLSILFFGSLLLALSKGQSEGWTSLFIVSLLFVAVSSLMLLLWVELTVKQPVLDLRIFKNMKFSFSVISSCLVMIGMMGGTFLTPLYLQNIHSLNAMETGLLMMPQAFIMALMMPIAGKLFDKIGILPLGVAGLTILGITTLKLHQLTTDTPNEWLNVVLCIRSVGIGLCMMPLTSAGMNALSAQQIGNGSTLSNVCRQVAGSMGIALFTAIMSSRQIFHYAHINESVSVDSYVANNVISGMAGQVYQWSVDMSTATGMATSVLAGIMQKEALARAISDTFYLSAIPAILCIPVVFFLRTRKKQQPAKEPSAADTGTPTAARQVEAPGSEPVQA
ncbi:DHA2 family efflux MFS transporter permease subunit [Paenibacillus thalictri]|uniref:DHA2 family efflux MFS transporter permease subunit n=1 Tax=Paenibacillus thalictri TaxID=2527873 RepID=A0A4Q9DS50_9BACL|nr:DHA2 family efflux MFS transporter permease subunit [Paenibacillus thalictri]TBL76574.1 DHA2 family efflux MFS transporter permease subunit [Paenibacillus thalictri]